MDERLKGESWLGAFSRVTADTQLPPSRTCPSAWSREAAMPALRARPPRLRHRCDAAGFHGDLCGRKRAADVRASAGGQPGERR